MKSSWVRNPYNNNVLWLRRNRDLIAVTLTALAVRVGWNLSVHPILQYAYADMGGYLERAQTSILYPDEPRGYFILFPWGTHALLALVMRVFGLENGTALGVAYAVLGALAVGYSFRIAARLTRGACQARAVGALLVVYYPWIALGGYALSEPPFTLLLSATVLHGLAYADRGRTRDAWLFGAALALAAIFRPQILVAVPLYGLHWLVRRRAWRRVRLGVVGPALAVPFLLVAIASAARDHFHTGAYGFIAANGPLNYAFGRCHATTISSFAPDRNGAYTAPSLVGLADYTAVHPSALLPLDPAMGTTLAVDGHMWDAAPMYALAAECARRTGPLRQAKYAVTHLALLWFFNVTWPDVGQIRFRPYMAAAQAVHTVLVLPAALWATVQAFRRRHARAMLVALHVLGLMAVAMLFFGDTRLRTPYDGLLIILAASVYTSAVRDVRRPLARSL
jgi:hypothetical protein